MSKNSSILILLKKSLHKGHQLSNDDAIEKPVTRLKNANEEFVKIK